MSAIFDFFWLPFCGPLTYSEQTEILYKSAREVPYLVLYNTLLNSDRLIGCLWSHDIE